VTQHPNDPDSDMVRARLRQQLDDAQELIQHAQKLRRRSERLPRSLQNESPERVHRADPPDAQSRPTDGETGTT
jgi:hypothetical protein